jgi:hypothetical protein
MELEEQDFYVAANMLAVFSALFRSSSIWTLKVIVVRFQ